MFTGGQDAMENKRASLRAGCAIEYVPALIKSLALIKGEHVQGGTLLRSSAVTQLQA